MSIRKAGAIIAGTGNGGGNPDDVTINKNNADKLQAIGTINKNTTGTISQLYNWMGTLAEYTEQNIETLHPEWVCFITDDADGSSQLNNPFSLLDYKYSEYELSNASWLLSNGQWNSGAVYQSVYDLLLQIYNGTVTKAGVSVKLSTEAYADTDFVLNTSDTTFRLPIKVLMAGSKRVAGNGMTLGLSSGTDYVGLGSDGVNPDRLLNASYGTYGQNYGSTQTAPVIFDGKSLGVTTDSTKSGIETSANGLYLYFYVGETVQDANIIAAGQALTDIADLKNASNFSQTGLSTLSGLGMPSDRYEDLTLGASESIYIAPANGWFLVDKLGDAGQYMFAANAKKYTGAQPWDYFGRVYTQTSIGTYANSSFTLWIPCQKGDRVCINYTASGAVRLFRFVYAEGEN